MKKVLSKSGVISIVITAAIAMVLALSCAYADQPSSDERTGLVSDEQTKELGAGKASPKEDQRAPAAEQAGAAVAEKPAALPGEAAVTAPEEKVPEEEKIKIEISEKEIASKVPSYKTDLKDIVREAESNIKKIDDALKAEDAEKGAKEHYDKGSALYNEGKFEEAGKEWDAALGLAKEREFRKCIRASLKRAARQIRQAKEKREAEEWAKKKAELRGQRVTPKTEPDTQKKEPDTKK